MIKKHNYRTLRKIHHRLSYNNTTTIAALFSVILILTGGGIGLPLLLQQQQQQAYASSQQVQEPAASSPSPTQEQSPSSQMQLPSQQQQQQLPSQQPLAAPTQVPLGQPTTPICNPNTATTLQLGSIGTKVVGLQRILTQLGYGPLLGQSGIDGKFGISTQNAVKNFQQHNRLQPVDGVVGPRTWEVLCDLMTSPAAPIQQQPAPIQQQQQPQGALGCTTARPIAVNIYNAFIHNSSTSTLDLLPRGLGEKYKNFNWDIYDYPGVNKGDPGPGPNEKMAHVMFQALAKIACEHRPIDPRGLTSTAVAKKDALNPYLNPTTGKYVLDQMIPVQGKNKLNKYAAESFAKMYAAAKADNVDLIILNSDRSCTAADAGAGRVGNVYAVAGCPNSHTIGLAIDFKMIPGPYQRGKEIHTTPMKNLVDLYRTPTHKWLFLNAQKYGWYPWNYEPWHWEYNPDNFRSTFFSQYKQFLANHEQNTPLPPSQR